MASTRKQGRSRAGDAGGASVYAAGDDDRVPSTCIVCGNGLLATQWLVSGPQGMLHYDCWDRSDTERVLTTLPASHLLEWSDDRKRLRRELRDTRQQHDEAVSQVVRERDAAISQRDAAISQRDAAVALHERVITQRDAALGVAFEKLDDVELEALRDKLRDTLKKVEYWQMARSAVERDYPDSCCSISRCLMRDPVCVVDGHCYERKQIESHFAKLIEKGQPLRTPHRTPVDTTDVVPNLHLRNIINSLVAAKAQEFAAAAEAQEAATKAQGSGAGRNPSA